MVLAGTLMFAAGTGVAGAANKSYCGIQWGVAGEYSEKFISQNFSPTVLSGRSGYEQP